MITKQKGKNIILQSALGILLILGMARGISFLSNTQLFPSNDPHFAYNNTITFQEKTPPQSQQLNQDFIRPYFWNYIGRYTISGTFDIDSQLIVEKPLAIRIIGGGSYHFFWNDKKIGTNGQQGINKTAEIEGNFIHYFYLPDSLASIGKHEYRIEGSNFYAKKSLLFCGIKVANFTATKSSLLIVTALVFLFGGNFIIASIYFLQLYLFGNRSKMNALMAGFCSLVFLLMVLEYLMYIWQYPYSLHLLRMTVIQWLTVFIQLLLIAVVLYKFDVPNKRNILIATTCLLAIIIWNPLSFWLSSNHFYQLWLLAVTGFVIAGIFVVKAYKQQKADSGLYLTGLLPGLLCWVYYDITLFLCYAFFVIYVLLSIVASRRRLEAEKTSFSIQSQQLQEALTQSQKELEAAHKEVSSPKALIEKASHLGIVQHGILQMIALEDINFIKGAGVYSELFLKNKQKKLHNKSLEKLSRELPASFQRIHKSYIVDLQNVKRIIVQSGGKYQCELMNSERIPLSRSKYRELKSQLL